MAEAMRIVVLLALAALVAASEDGYQPFDHQAMLGVRMAPPSAAIQLLHHTPPELGVEVLRIHRDSPAQQMQLQPGDLIIRINGGDITMMSDLRHEVGLAGVGGAVTVEYLREGELQEVTGTIAAWPDDIPKATLDDEAERAFREWQARRHQRLTAAVAGWDQRLTALEQRSPELVPPHQAALLQQLPAFRLRLRVEHRSDGTGPLADHPVAWDARVLIGSTTPDRH